MTRYPTHLHFDSSKSAVVRFFGEKVAEVSIHWADRKVPQVLMACPDSIGILENKPCLFCGQFGHKVSCTQRSVVSGWDLRKNRWCIYMAPCFIVQKIFQHMSNAGFTGKDMAAGTAPDVILQRQRGNTLIVVMEETVGEKRGDGNLPPIEDYLRGLQSRSVWATYARPSELPERV